MAEYAVLGLLAQPLPGPPLLFSHGERPMGGAELGVASKRQLLGVWKAGGREQSQSPPHSVSLVASVTSNNHLSFLAAASTS